MRVKVMLFACFCLVLGTGCQSDVEPSAMVVGPLETVFDRKSDASDLFGVDENEHPYGLWIDGAIHPWKDAMGTSYFNIPHSENYRVRVPSWNDSTGWVVQSDPIFDSRVNLQGPTADTFYHLSGHCNSGALTETEPDYDNRIWLMGFWSTGDDVYALAHHEWYRDCSNGYKSSADLKGWINGVHHLSSSDGGSSFRPASYKPYASTGVSNAWRLVLIPEPSSVQEPQYHHGFFHPSNIVQEGHYYYALVDYRETISAGAIPVATGFVMIRTTEITTPTGWEFYTQDGWRVIRNTTYQGNLGQAPHVFFLDPNWDPTVKGTSTNMLAQSIHYHRPSGQWIAFGLSGDHSGVTYLFSPSLFDPQWETNGVHVVEGTEGINWYPYVSAIDHDASDLNYVEIGTTVHLYKQVDQARLQRIPITVELPPAR